MGFFLVGLYRGILVEKIMGRVGGKIFGFCYTFIKFYVDFGSLFVVFLFILVVWVFEF